MSGNLVRLLALTCLKTRRTRYAPLSPLPTPRPRTDADPMLSAAPRRRVTIVDCASSHHILNWIGGGGGQRSVAGRTDDFRGARIVHVSLVLT